MGSPSGDYAGEALEDIVRMLVVAPVQMPEVVARRVRVPRIAASRAGASTGPEFALSRLNAPTLRVRKSRSIARESSLDWPARVRVSRLSSFSAQPRLQTLASPREERLDPSGVNLASPEPSRADAEPGATVDGAPRARSSLRKHANGDGWGRRSRCRASFGRYVGGILVRTATLDEVARAAGVSRATASRVVNGSTTVRPDARHSVEQAVARLGYVPNGGARSLATHRSDSIGVVIAETTTKVFSDPFFLELLRGIGAGLNSRHMQLALLMPQSPEEERRLEQYLGSGHVDGAIFVSLHGDDPLPERLHEQGVPVVVGGEPPRGARVSYVDNDNHGGAVLAVNHLVAHGRRTIATITGPLDMPGAASRRQGYLDALRAAGIAPRPELEAGGDFTREGGSRAVRELLGRCPEIDAVARKTVV